MSISNQLSENPGLIVLINNPTEEDLLKVIYSKNTMDSIISDLPDGCITAGVANVALCLSKDWSKDSLNIWFNKFFPQVLPEDQLKVFKSIYNYLPVSPWSGKDIDLFIDLFSKVNNPTSNLVDYYLAICVKDHRLGIGKDYSSEYTPQYYIVDSALTSNISGKLNDSQQKSIIDNLSSREYIYLDTNRYFPYNSGSLKLVYKEWIKFITNKAIYEEGKTEINLLVKEMQDAKDEEDKSKDKAQIVHWWQKRFWE